MVRKYLKVVDLRMIHHLEVYKKGCMYIWLMLALSVFLCGMCVEKVYPDSSLCLSASNKEGMLLYAQEYDAVQADLLPVEILTQQTDITPIRNTKRDNLRIYLRIFMNLMLVSILPQVLFLSLEVMARGSFFYNHSHDFIIYFIHQKDGEKDC